MKKLGCQTTILLLALVAGGLWYGGNLAWKAIRGDVANDWAVTLDDQLVKVCEDTYYTTAPAYTGTAAPHPIAVYDLGEKTPRDELLIGPDIPAATSKAWNPAKADVQLVGCAEKVADGAEIGTCEFDSGIKAPVRTGVWEVRLREVKTRKEIATVRIDGKDKTCPLIKLVKEGEEPVVYSSPSVKQYYDALKQYVEG
ncbi:hypothetical protein [Actinoplanes utahensis]|uniref:Uncharacterized protein n=1 Tax=Actinoplanes utahensis TaxID=1869 RepID=A0A0A6X4D3_ACTUT|nr:hypothetical protein [Actinoplanes utahensis]KHD74967.1 hypothetical protein MB27_25400 [Actinoplanes utahensis]GIF34938.1 hypothetical protein Aut01nite_79240 [Actinoplanes utahensis]